MSTFVNVPNRRKGNEMEFDDTRYLAQSRKETIVNVYAILTDESLGEPLRLARAIEYLSYKVTAD